MVALDVLVRIPVAPRESIVTTRPDLHEANSALEQAASRQAFAAKVVDLFLALSVLVVFLIYYHISLSWHIVWVVPIFGIQLIFTYGLSLFLAAANLLYRDIQYVLGLGLIVWMYLTPVIYPTEMFPDRYRWIFQINPMAVFINAYRQVILAAGEPNYMSLGIAAVVSTSVLMLGYWFFKKLEGVFADVV